MQRFLHLLVILIAFHSAAGQVYDYSIGQQIEKIDSVEENLIAFQVLGIKEGSSPALIKTRDWLISKYQQFGYDQISLDTFYFSGNEHYNVIIDKPGLDPNRYIIIGAHYDTRNGPGANDNGSGVAACLEIARIVFNIETRLGIRFIHFAAEEHGMIGSDRYVKNTLDTNDIIELMINLDQLGGTAGEDNSKIFCERDESSTRTENNAASYLKTDTLANLVKAYSFLEPVISAAYSSDYIPFERAGYVITGLFQQSFYPFRHLENDWVSNMDVSATTQVVQCALAAALYFARHTMPLSVGGLTKTPIKVYPNPARDMLYLNNPNNKDVRLRLFNQMGIEILDRKLSPGENLDIAQLSAGPYFIMLLQENDQVIQYTKLIIAH